MSDTKDILSNALRTTAISVQSADQPDHARAQGFLVGKHQQDYLLFGGLGGFTAEPGETLVVRMLLGNEVVGFRSQVHSLIDDAPPVWRVSYPTAVESINLRKSPRLAVFIPADIRSNATEPAKDAVQLLRAKVLNISNGGCLFSSKSAVSPNDSVSLSFTLPGDRMVHTIKGEVLETGRAHQVFSQRVRFSNGNTQAGPLSEINAWVQENAPFSFY